MSVKVTITIEQDDMQAAVPVSVTFRHDLGGTTANPRYAGDQMQTAVIEAAASACTHLAHLVDLRTAYYATGRVQRAITDLSAVVGEAPDAA